MKHRVSEEQDGDRHTLGIIFHDAVSQLYDMLILHQGNEYVSFFDNSKP